MAIHWQIPFKSLRTGTGYTVNIYDASFSGSPVVLMGGAQPFTTQEDDNEDMFTPIRTQTGYIRIVDNGKDANGNAWNWKDLLPSTDTDRPVTLTDGGGNVVWQGFMQAQNFGGVLYGNPQEREFPVHCALTILEGTDINYQQTAIQNFAYLLKQVTDCIATQGGSVVAIQNVIIQGDTDAQQWLLKRIDWQNFTDEDGDGNLTARFNLYQCLEDLCRFWGWTARTYRSNLYLTRADDSDEQTFVTLTMANLATMAGGTAAGTTGGAFTMLEPSGDIFASVDQNDIRQRGPNKATVKADANAFSQEIYESFPSNVVKEMERGGWIGSVLYDDVYVNYTNNKLTFNAPFFAASAVSGNGSFNLASFSKGSGTPNKLKVVRILKSYNGSAFVSLDSLYEHNFDGYLQLKGSFYQRGKQYEEDRGPTLNKHMKIAIGIGKTRATAKWYTGGVLGSWSTTKTVFDVAIGYTDNIIRPFTDVVTNTNGSIWAQFLQGKLFIDLYGSADLDEFDGQRLFDLAGLMVSYSRYEFGVEERLSTIEYKSSNQNNVRMEWNADCIYASDNYNVFGFGTLINPEGTYFNTISYNGGTAIHPEQHLANRVTAYWAAAKRKLEVELKTNAITEPTPQNRVKLDATIGYPIAIGREWRDDITRLTILAL